MTGEHGPDHGRDPDAAEVDRAFAEIVANLDQEAPDPPQDSDPLPEPPAEWARFTPRAPDPEPEDRLAPEQPEEAEEGPDNHYVPEPPAPLPRPGPRVLLGLGMMGFAVAVAAMTVLGMTVPSLIRLAGVASFIAGFLTLVAQLPRTRPEDDDGVVL